MNKILIFLCFFIIVGVEIVANSNEEKPKLVVGIVVDQMRYDYLQRYWDKFGEGGFKRLVNDGFSCKNTHYNYAPTYTGPGHASIYTGTTPTTHGIIANTWYDKFNDTMYYCVSDVKMKTIGSSSTSGHMSPNSLLTTTITDELRLSNNNLSKVIGIALKDRASVLPAGHNANGAYWYDGATGNWITSSFYNSQLPDWLNKYNVKANYTKYLSESWKTLNPIESYEFYKNDNSLFETKLVGEKTSAFPHKVHEIKDQNNGPEIIKATPFGNTITREVAIEALVGEQLGKDNITDFLAISFSSTDIIGHKYGVNSVELEDTYLRLDKELAELLTALDTKVGEDNYLLFLTADHAVVRIPNRLKEQKIPAGYVNEEQLMIKLQEYLKEEYGEGKWLNNLSNNQVFINEDFVYEKDINLEDMENNIARFLLDIDGVANALTSGDLLSGSFANFQLDLVKNGYHQKRSGNIALVLESGWIGYRETGTTHGSPYNYDTHVPLLWFGKNIRKGSSVDYIAITDIAPTIAMFLDIQFPSGCSGRPIKILFKE